MEELSSGVLEALRGFAPEEQILLNEPMSRHTTFRVGGEAKALIQIDNVSELIDIISYLNKVQEPYYIKGNGSNILVGDKGYNGIILEMGQFFSGIRVEDNEIIAQSGALMSRIAKTALDYGLSGFEFAAGIPGTIGGGVVMNAGAYGGELKDVVTQVSVLNPEGEMLTLRKEDLEFGYRTSVIKHRPLTVTEVRISLSKGDKAAIRDRMDELSSQRKAKQPLEYPSAGSTFKRPEGYYAGKLIMDAGLRGYSIGGAAVSEKHCGFVINKGNATAADIYEVIVEVQTRVKARFDVNLEPEIVFLGTF